MNPLRSAVEAIADHIHAEGDATARAYGLTVTRLPWGGRCIHDPRVAVHLEQRRARVLRTGGDRADRAILAADPATRAALAATAGRLARTTRRPAADPAARPLRPAA